ncbi:MAG: class I SAM-dependent methyltransferase [Chloroflexi bacterium]|nr:class I SAM-dependent methyltransferase [Chloroflexota bacterium]
MTHVDEHNILPSVIACPVCSAGLLIKDADTQAVCSNCSSTFIKGNYVWNFIPTIIEWTSPVWRTWQQVQANALVAYQSDPEHNLAVGEREDCHRFASFCNCSGLVLDVGCGPQPWPSYFRRSPQVTYVGVDPLIEDTPGDFIRLRALAEFLPFRANAFDYVLFGTSLDHFVDPVAALRAAARVCKSSGEIDIWIGEKSPSTPEPAVSHEWYRRLQKPDLAEDSFHIKRLSTKMFTDLATTCGLTVVQTEVYAVDNYRTNYFYRLKITK